MSINSEKRFRKKYHFFGCAKIHSNIETSSNRVTILTTRSTGLRPKGLRRSTIFNINDIAFFNQKYQTEKYYKNYVIFASNGGGESFGFIKNQDFEILKVPFVQMNEKYKIKLTNTSEAFVNSFKTLFSKKIENKEDYEIIEIQPIILGGSPTSKENKSAIKREQHFEYVTFWNNKIDEIIKESGNPTTAST